MVKTGHRLCIKRGVIKMSQVVIAIILVSGIAGIACISYGLGKLSDYIEEMYGYDRNSHT